MQNHGQILKGEIDNTFGHDLTWQRTENGEREIDHYISWFQWQGKWIYWIHEMRWRNNVVEKQIVSGWEIYSMTEMGKQVEAQTEKAKSCKLNIVRFEMSFSC